MDKGNLNKVHFLPWVGKDYATGGIFKKRIMVLGESHIADPDSPEINDDANFTTKDVEWYLGRKESDIPRWMNTFTKFEEALAGKELAENEEKEVWNSLLFYNYLQTTATHAREDRIREEFDNSADAFFEVLNHFEPEYIIAWGTGRLYNYTPGIHWQPGEFLSFDGVTGKTGTYQLDNGHLVKVLFISHPSTAFSWTRWHEVIKRFLRDSSN